jgi:alpha-L-rhamnosidase
LRAIHLKTEYLENPIGIDYTTPRVFWNCEDGITQSAYQIVAGNEQNDITWDTGKVQSNLMTHIPYKGKTLCSRERITWKVKLWDENDKEGSWSEEAFFEMGLLYPEDWKAKWITGDYIPKKKERYPVDYFLKKFKINPNGKADQKIVKARLYTTACGIYEAQINGNRVGEFILAPGITDYRKRVQYQVYDVLALLQAGENQLTYELADGWYRGSVGAWGMRNYYGSETKLLAQLELTRADGSVETICSDENFAWSNDGLIRFADNKDGEVVDANQSPSHTHRAKVTSHHVIPQSSNNVPIKEHERFEAELRQTPSGKQVLDFGQNIAGYIEFTIHGKKGQRVFLRFGEMLDEQGEFTQKNIQVSSKRKTSPLQQVEYRCKEGENHYKTKFAIFGFQYVLVETEVEVKPEDFTAIAVYSHMEQRTIFHSSNALLNQFVESTLWSAKNNSADLPTDCPTRERHGWTGDAQIFFNTAAYLMDYATFAMKYERDVMDWQTKDGKLPQIAPEGGTDFYMRVMNGACGWADAGVMIPYRFWKIYGDSQILKEHYEGMKKYAGFVLKRCGKNAVLSAKNPVKGENRKYIINIGQAYGEWAEPTEVHKMSWKDFVIPPMETATAYASYLMQLMSEIAEELGKKEDAKFYAEKANKIKIAYQELVRCEGYTLDTNQQAKLVRPLYFGLLDENQKEFAKKRFIQALEQYDWRLGTGFLSTPLILDVLEEYDLEAAYKVLENEQMPGWLFMPKSGANTIWESWEGTSAQGGIASLDHYSKGACVEWLFREMCGIHVEGCNHFRIAPKPGGHFTFAKTCYQSVYGTIISSWEKKEDGSYVYHITVPANTTADIELLDGNRRVVEAGKYEFNVIELTI